MLTVTMYMTVEATRLKKPKRLSLTDSKPFGMLVTVVVTKSARPRFSPVMTGIEQSVRENLSMLL